MTCPRCHSPKSSVRKVCHGTTSTIRYRRCQNCGKTFKTEEQVTFTFRKTPEPQRQAVTA